jgi:uncharacterized membrane protein YqjE
MDRSDNGAPGLTTLVRRLSGTLVGAVQNRAELLSVEWQEERAHLMELLVWAIAFVFLALMGVVLLTATIIFLCPEKARVYVTAGFALLYFLGALGTWFGLKRLLAREPFADTVNQVKKDRVWLDSFK